MHFYSAAHEHWIASNACATAKDRGEGGRRSALE